MSAWNHLPNAGLIDRIFANSLQRPLVWAIAWDCILGVEVREETYDKARGAANIASSNPIRKMAYNEAYDKSIKDGMAATRTASVSAAWGAIAALIAWDHAGAYFDLPRDQVRTLAALGDNIAILILPAVISLSNLEESCPK